MLAEELLKEKGQARVNGKNVVTVVVIIVNIIPMMTTKVSKCDVNGNYSM